MYAFIAHSHTILDYFYVSMDRERELTGSGGDRVGGASDTVFACLAGYSEFSLFLQEQLPLLYSIDHS